MPTSPESSAAADVDELYRDVERAMLDRWPETKLDPSLDRIAALCDLLGQPQRAYPVIQLTGTNGKTTTARMVDTLVRGLGLAHGPVHQPARGVDDRTHQHRRRAAEQAAVRRGLRRSPAVRRDHRPLRRDLDVVLRAGDGDGLRRVRRRPGRRRGHRGRHGRHLGRDQRRRRGHRHHHADRRRPRALSRRHASRHRGREGRHPQVRHGRHHRAATRRGSRGADAPRRSGRGHGGARGARVRRTGPGAWCGWPDGHLPRTSSDVRRGVPAAARRPPGTQRGLCAGRSRVLCRRGRRRGGPGPRARAAGVCAGHLPGPARDRTPLADGRPRLGAQPARRTRERRSRAGGVRRSARSSASSGSWPTRTSRACSRPTSR